MKVLFANKFYYPRGGDCVYTLSLEQLLKQRGHEVAVYAQKEHEFMIMENNFTLMENKVAAMENNFMLMENKVAAMENNFMLMENKVAAMENNFMLMENKVAAMENNIPDHFVDVNEMVVRCRPHACAGSPGKQANFHNPVQVARSATRCGVWARSAATLHPRPSATPAGGGEPRGEQVGIKEMMVFRTKRSEQD